MSELVKIERSEVCAKLLADEEFKSLLYNNAWFYGLVNQLEQGLTADQLMQAVGCICKANQGMMTELIDYKMRYGSIQKL